jgi:hypothetical protein
VPSAGLEADDNNDKDDDEDEVDAVVSRGDGKGKSVQYNHHRVSIPQVSERVTRVKILLRSLKLEPFSTN